MVRINSRTLFLTTSPRSPLKMLPEIEVLVGYFSGEKWNRQTQCLFMETLSEKDFFEGHGSSSDPTFSARDRITRAPKSLGFVVLKPTIQLSPAGHTLLYKHRKEETLLRQMMKFQVPSPYHVPTAQAAHFCVKPYLEILRLIRTLGTLKFDELRLFGMQLTDWHDFDIIVQKIEKFRMNALKKKGSYRKFYQTYAFEELKHVFAGRIARGETKTRESDDKSLKKFLSTQFGNMRDYADACYRYLKATGLINVSQVGKSLSIVPERTEDVDFLLSTIDRTPFDFKSEKEYAAYLGETHTPALLSDDKGALLKRIQTEFPHLDIDKNADIESIKDVLADNIEQRKSSTIQKQIADIKEYRLYADIQETFNRIVKKDVLDAPLMLEWNMWRAMTMLDGGDIKANLFFDDYGNPMSVARGNMADIVCEYDDFVLIVEVTLASGQRQYEAEGEPISRHLGALKRTSNKPCYCLFVAPVITPSCIAHFFALHHLNISYYGGKSVIVPLPLFIFQKMLENSYKATYVPSSSHVKSFFERSRLLASSGCTEIEWFDKMKEEAIAWPEHC